MVRGSKDRRRKPVKARSQTAKRKPARTNVQDNSTPVLDAAKLKALYTALMRCRLMGERLNRLAREENIPARSFAPAGQEAAIVGTTLHLLPEDMIAPSPMMFLASHILGTPADLVFSHATGGRAAIPVKEHLHAAAGMALSCKLRQRPAVVLALVDDADTMPGFWHEAVSFSSTHRLPIVIAVCTSPEQPPLRDQALSFGLPGITVDGHDVVAVFRVAQESIRRAREGHGPTLIECKMVPAEPNREGSGDSVTFMEAYLAKRKLWTQAWKHQLTQQISRELKQMTGSISK